MVGKFFVIFVALRNAAHRLQYVTIYYMLQYTGLSCHFETLDMNFEGLGDMFEGDNADICMSKSSLTKFINFCHLKVINGCLVK
jgi:hypothetical protein